ncbi:hypothetical protein [Paenirhodobacter populi]|uniref:Uncharacterized protein n=1 Tax=Paenirhodobacter populi TaxID=2306993 RepID=A0A443JE49_9RHOB|nr:hypothetical protein [Sinirhodobacter populi]RWR18798.1 hypothetical protein D2T30_15670 [Sinirhodobacter populi]
MAVEMEGAAIRLEREREMVWFSAMLPYLERPVTLKAFVGRKEAPKSRAARVKAFHAAWDRIDRALGRQ